MNFRIMGSKFLKGALAIGIWAGLSGSATAGDYAIVVNAANQFSGSNEAIKQQVRRIFLKEQSTWPDKAPGIPFDREAASPSHAAFLSQVLGMSQSQIETHWLRLKQTAGETPPREVGSARILLRLIGREAGGMGVVEVSELEGAPAKVKVLFTFSD